MPLHVASQCMHLQLFAHCCQLKRGLPRAGSGRWDTKQRKVTASTPSGRRAVARSASGKQTQHLNKRDCSTPSSCALPRQATTESQSEGGTGQLGDMGATDMCLQDDDAPDALQAAHDDMEVRIGTHDEDNASEESLPPVQSISSDRVHVTGHTPRLYQSRLVPTTEGLVLANPGVRAAEGGEQAAASEPHADGDQLCDEPVSSPKSRTCTIPQLLWPEAQAQRGLLPGEHKIRPALTVTELADEDDGQLRAEVVVDAGSLDDYLRTAGGPGLATAEHAISHSSADSDAEGSADGRVQFIASDEEDAASVEDNVEGNLAGLPGAELQDDCDEQVSGAEGGSTEDANQLPAAPMDAQVLQRMLEMLRARGGQFEIGVIPPRSVSAVLPISASCS
jgi:hypothetical protein